MASVNKVILIGNLGRDPEVRYSENGAAVCNISIATSRQSKDQAGNYREETEWHRVVMFNRTAEIAGEYLNKGSPVYIEGSLRTRKWKDQGGQDRYSTEVVATRMQMLGSKSNAAAPQQQSSAAPQSNYIAPTAGINPSDTDNPF